MQLNATEESSRDAHLAFDEAAQKPNHVVCCDARVL